MSPSSAYVPAHTQKTLAQTVYVRQKARKSQRTMFDGIRNQLRPRPAGDSLLREVLPAGGLLVYTQIYAMAEK